ncbi:MAG: baseplate J/gp47 family protein [Faecalibacterium prausnitzii]
MKYVGHQGQDGRTVKYSKLVIFWICSGAFRCGAIPGTRPLAAVADHPLHPLRAPGRSVTAVPQGARRIAAGQLFFTATSAYAETPAGDLTADIPATCMTAGETGNSIPSELKTLVDPVCLHRA